MASDKIKYKATWAIFIKLVQVLKRPTSCEDGFGIFSL